MDKQNPIATLSKSFALRIVKLERFLREEKMERVLSKQLLRSGTSIGANIRESIYAQSKADFISKMSIALKESSETEYWLELLHESGVLSDAEYESIYNDNSKLSATLINIIKKPRNRRNNGYWLLFNVYCKTMGRAFEYRKAAKLKRWGHMAKTFTKIGKQIAIAVKAGGPEPDMNPALRAIIANAKRENMPKDNIERAIKNAMGKDQSDYKEVTYEGYGPHGVAIFVDTLTDNTTRTVGDVRSVFNKFNGNLGTQGSLSFLFDHKCVFTFKKTDGLDMDEMILDLIDYGVEDEYDEDEEENSITIYGDPSSFGAIQKHLEENGFEVTGAEFTRIPNDLKDVTPEERETIDKMIEKLEDFDDVQTVYTNMKPEGIEE